MVDPEFPPRPLGDPEELRSAAIGLRGLQSGFDRLVPYVRGIAVRLYDQAWRGKASVAFLDHCDHIQWIMSQCGDRAGEYARVCDLFAEDLQVALWGYEVALADFEEARELYHRSFLADDTQAAQWRLTGEEDMLAAVERGWSAVRDAEAAERQAAAGFASIAPPTFGSLTERLFDPHGTVRAAADTFGEASDAAGEVGAVMEQERRLRLFRSLGTAAEVAKWGRRLSVVGDVLHAPAAGLEQYAEDVNNPLLTEEERIARAAQDAVVRSTSAAAAGAALSTQLAGIGFLLGGPVGASVLGIAGDLIGSELGDRRAEEVLDRARGEAGVPEDATALPGPNRVVGPPPPPPQVDSGSGSWSPVGHAPPEFQDHAGIRLEPPPRPPSQAWLDMQAALRDGVPAPVPAPQPDLAAT
jgi:hypothetical protein